MFRIRCASENVFLLLCLSFYLASFRSSCKFILPHIEIHSIGSMAGTSLLFFGQVASLPKLAKKLGEAELKGNSSTGAGNSLLRQSRFTASRRGVTKSLQQKLLTHVAVCVSRCWCCCCFCHCFLAVGSQ